MNTPAAIDVRSLTHSYGARKALRELTLEVALGEMFAVVGPNGGGKTTLFRVLSTLVPLQSGEVRVLGYDLARQPHEVRRHIGVVFQAPSLDKKLTVAENIRFQAALYGLTGAALRGRQDALLAQLGLGDRARDRAETLSGGLRRRTSCGWRARS